jgi:hypothetical protein
MVVGLETGEMLIWALIGENEWQKVLIVPEYYSHCATVRRIKFN